MSQLETPAFSIESDDEGLMPLPKFCARFGISRAQAYRHIEAGKLTAKKAGRATSITFSSIRSWWRSLPELKRR
jgi:hypothetical protein